jgi:hypothetical protein
MVQMPFWTTDPYWLLVWQYESSINIKVITSFQMTIEETSISILLGLTRNTRNTFILIHDFNYFIMQSVGYIQEE